MCGIIGFSGKSGKTFDLNKLKILMIQNSFERGKDSTGVFTPKTGLIKSTDAATKFLSDSKLNILDDNIFIGHVRAATVGLKTAKNAHPFKYGNLTLCHNGTLTNSNELCLKSPNNLKWVDFDVDSQVIAARLNLERNSTVLTQLTGAAAVLFHLDEDSEAGDFKNTMFAFRNSERPLYRGNTEEGLYISSIKESLEIIGCTDIKEFIENYLYTITDGIVKSPYKLNIVKPEQKEFTVKDKMNFISGSTYNNLIGKWVKSKFNCGGVNYVIKKDEWYFVLGFATKDKMFITKYPNDKTENIIMGPVEGHLLDKTSCDYEVGEYLMILTDLVYTDSNIKICDKGAVVKASREYQWVMDCNSIINNSGDITKEIFSCKFEYLRKAEAFEVLTYLNSFDLKDDSTDIIKNNVVYNFTDEEDALKALNNKEIDAIIDEKPNDSDEYGFPDLDESIIHFLKITQTTAYNALLAIRNGCDEEAITEITKIISEIEESLTLLE